MKQKGTYYNTEIRSGSPRFADWYHAVMALALINQKKTKDRARFYHNFRSIPLELDSSYLLMSGVNFALDHLANFRFENEDIEGIVGLAKSNKLKVTKDFTDYMETAEFTGNVWVIPEGQLAFAGEPTMIIEAPSIEALMPETSIIGHLTYATLVATRASRVVKAAQGIPIAEFGARRSPNPMLSTWAARVGGCASTSNILGANVYGIPISGTMAHAYVMMYENEFDAFVAFYESTGSNIFLIDTYDPIQGAINAIKAAKHLGIKVMVRLDSGDPIELVPKILALNTEGVIDRIIYRDPRQSNDGTWINGDFISDDLNIKKIDRIRKSGISVKAFGVGTYMVVVPSASSVFKLTEQKLDNADAFVPKMKVSSSNPAKSTLPGNFTIWRREEDGMILGDIIALRKEKRPGNDYKEVMVQVMKNGKLLGNLSKLPEIYEFAQANLMKLPESQARIENFEQYPVVASSELAQLKQELIANAKKI